MKDTIYRQDAIDAIQERINQLGYVHNPYVLSIKQAIREVPSVESEQKTGKWIYLGHGYKCPWSCSECDSCSADKTDYCPDCGAKMEI